MHSYLQSIGFKNISKDLLSEVFYLAAKNPTGYDITLDSLGNEFSEIRYEIADNMGIAFRGSYNDNDIFNCEYYFPYYESMIKSSNATVHVVKESDRECYQGVCEDNNVGIDVIFHLQNMIPYISSYDETTTIAPADVSMSGLSLEGKIILPIYSDEKTIKNRRKAKVVREEWLSKAREGDADAYEKLTLDDMDKYTMISKRIQSEDVLSIVRSTFMPSGIENDKYSIIGEIIDIKQLANEITNQNVYILSVDCNDLKIDVCINQDDLLGQPAIGRRFKGVIWTQGRINAI